MCNKCQALKSAPPFGAGWHDMALAPLDGSIVEIESRAGAKPHRNLYRWAGCWVSVKDPRMSIEYGAHAWRQFNGDPQTYTDPYAGFDDFDFVIRGKRPLLKLGAAELRYRLSN